MFGVALETGPKQALSPESAAALDLFDQFVNAQTFKAVLGTFRLICDTLRIKPTNLPNFYPKLKAKLRSWKAQALWAKFDKRASHKCYNRGKACANTRVLIIGAGPCGLRTAIEAQLLGAKVVVVEKRDRFSRNNVLHLWPFVIHDLRNLGAKKFYGKFCAGAIDHISIRQLQCVLLKVALLLGVEVHENVSFEELIEPPVDQSQEKIGWRATLAPKDHPVSNYEFDVLVGADGKRNTLKGFKRKEFRGKLAIAITANFINRHSEEEARVQEISGVAFIFNQKFFQDLHDATGIDLENIVYYKDETHYFVMTAKKYSLIEKGVILNDYADTARLLAADNVNRDALLEYAREAADFSTNFQMPHLEFAVNHYGQADVAMFDFTSMFQAESACRVVEKRGHKLLQALVGDSLLEPFWPTGSGCARGFLSSMDACWMIRSWSLGFMTPLQVLAERESIYRLLAQTTPENLSKDTNDYTLNPSSRYPNLNSNAARPTQMKGLYDTDGELKDEPLEMPLPKKKRKRDSFVHPDTLLNWCQRQVILYKNVSIENMTISWKNGLALCAIIHRYRPDLIDFHSLKEDDAERNNHLAFDICEREYGILPVMTPKEMAESIVPDALAIMSYISQIYDTFRGEIPYVARAPLTDLSPDERPASPSRKSPVSRFSFLSRLGQRLGSKKRYSVEKMEKDRALNLHLQEQEQDNEIAEALKRAKKRRSLERDRALFILNKNSVSPTLTSYKKTEASLEDRENFVSRVRDLEEKLYGTGKKFVPPPNVNALKVGKIDRGDWNVKMLEERLKGNKSVVKKDREEVPKWSRDIFEDKLRTMDQKLRSDSQEELAKYTSFDLNLRMLDKKLKEGNNLETGQRGMNKVSAMAEHLSASLDAKPQSMPLERSNSKTSLMPQQNASETCHFCNKRVYLMERHSAHGKFFHRGCFKCECCGVSLRLGSYGIGTESPYIGKFLCMHHFNMRIIPRKRPSSERDSEPKKSARVLPMKVAAALQFQASQGGGLEVPDSGFEKTRGVTPERVEFENSVELTSEEELLSEIDEDEFTERNFGNSASEFDSTDEESDFSSDEMADEAREELEEALHNSLSSDQTIRLAETWNRRHFKRRNLEDDDDEEEETDEDYGESGEEYSYEEYENEDDESTATEGEVQDDAGEGPSERVASSADELDRDGDVQLTVPRHTDKPWETDNYHKLQSNEGTGTEEESESKTSDSELYSGTDTETDTESQGDEDDEDKADEADDDSEDCQGVLPHRSLAKAKHKHFIPTIVIDEMTASAPNEDDDSYFVTLQEQSLQAERTLEDLIQEQLTESAVETPETPSVLHYVKEEMHPLVATIEPKQFAVPSGDDHAVSIGDLVKHTDSAEKVSVDISVDQADGTEIDVLDIVPMQSVIKVNDLQEELVSSSKVSPKPNSEPIRNEQMVCSVVPEPTKPKVSGPVVESSPSQKLSSLPESAKVRDEEKDRHAATESSTAKMMLKLKERYLLGNVSAPETQSTTLDPDSPKLEPVVKSFLEMISEKQKMLSPAPSPAPSALHRPLGLNFGEISPSSPTSFLSSFSSEPLQLQVGSSPLSRISPVSPLSIGSCAISPSPTSDCRSDISFGLDKPLLAQTLETADDHSLTEINAKLEESQESRDVPSEDRSLMNGDVEIIMQDDNSVAASGVKDSEVIPSNGGITGILSDLEELHDRDAKEKLLRMGFEKEIHPVPLSPPISSTVIEVYSESSPEEQLKLDVQEDESAKVTLPSEEMEVEAVSSKDDTQGQTSDWHTKVETHVMEVQDSGKINVGLLDTDDTEGYTSAEAEVVCPLAEDLIEVQDCKGISAKQLDMLDAADRIGNQKTSIASPTTESMVEVHDSTGISIEHLSADDTENQPSAQEADILSPTAERLMDLQDSEEIIAGQFGVEETEDQSSAQQTERVMEVKGSKTVSTGHLGAYENEDQSSDKQTEIVSPTTESAVNVQDSAMAHWGDSRPSLGAFHFDNIDTKNITFRNKSQSGKAEVDLSDIVIPDSVWNESPISGSAGQEVPLDDLLVQTLSSDPVTGVEEHLQNEKPPCVDVLSQVNSGGLPEIFDESSCLEDRQVLQDEITLQVAKNNGEDSKFVDVFSPEKSSSAVEEVQQVSADLRPKQSGNDETSDDAAKSEDELLDILSASISSDSDTTPSLDESIYTTPETKAKLKLSSKFGSYSSHFAEHSFPFGGVRDSIDIRKSAMKKQPGSMVPPSAKLNLYGDCGSNFNSKSEPAERLCLLTDTVRSPEKVPQEQSKNGSSQESSNVEEIPFVDDESSQESSERGTKADQNFTPMTTNKRLLQRRLSITETCASSSSPVLAVKKHLPDTPLINSERLMTPNSVGEAIDDLRQLRTVEREKARQLARERARLKSDEELGLRTVDYKNLRRKYQRTDSVSSDIHEENGAMEVKVPENHLSDDRACDKVEVPTTPESVVDSVDSLPSFEKTSPSGIPESSSPDSEVFEVCSPLMSPCNKELATVSQSPESSDHVTQSIASSISTNISIDTTASISEATKTNDSSNQTADSNNGISMGASTTASFSEVVRISDSNSNSTEGMSKTECTSYLEPELALDDVELKISPDSCDASSSTPSIINNNNNNSSKAKSGSLPGLISKKDKSKGQATVDKPDKTKSKERKSLLSIFANFGKSDLIKNKNKEEKKKSPHSSTSSAQGTESSSQSLTNPLSPLEGAAIKVDGTPKESRFPKLRLARSKEKAKEKRKQKYLMDSQKEGSSSPSPPKKTTPMPPSEVAGAPAECVQHSVSLNEGAPRDLSEAPAESQPVELYNVGSKPADIQLDRQTLIASMASLSKQIPSSAKLQNGIAPQASEDSFSDPEEDNTEKSQASSASGSVKKTKDLTEERKRKYHKLAQRMYRQQEQKRLRTAQEIQRQLEELEVKQREMETRGVEVEKALRSEGEGSDAQKGEPELMKEWFQLVHDKNVLVRHEQELMVKAKELELEDRHSRLQHELHQRMAIDDSKKTPEEIEEEGNILTEMLEIVEQRDTLIALLEENRQRHQEEDRDFELSMQAKGMRFLSFTRS